MHLVLDLQACQSPESRRRGIGRFSLALAKAMAAQPRDHAITLLLNAAMGEPIEILRGEFEGLLPQSRIRTWTAVAPTGRAYPDNRFRQCVSEIVRLQVLRELKPDFVHVASLFEGMADDVIATVPADAAYPSAVTLYDLIPLAHQETYLTHPGVREWYMEKVGFLRHSRLLLGISNFACGEARDLLGMPADRVVNISGAADAIFRRLDDADSVRAEVMSRYGLQKRFIMYAGGFDPRKNIAALIRAFALLPSETRRAYQLAIVGGAPEPERHELIAQMSAAGVEANEVVFTGYVSDAELVRLYNLCELYVFPSLQEGFGLPALEAMSCGAVVIGSDTSSLPEVIGRADALFDPRDDRSIAKKMSEALTDASFRVSLAEHARHQPAKFTWQESARLALDAFESAHEQPSPIAKEHGRRRKRVKQRTAWLPAPNSNAVISSFGKTKIYADADCAGAPRLRRRSLERFKRERDRFDRVVVELADDPYCARTLVLTAEGEADLLIRDSNFGRLLQSLAAESETRPLLVDLLYRSGGYPSLREAIDADFSAEVLARLGTSEGLATLGECQIAASEDAILEGAPGQSSWRERTRRLLAEVLRAEGRGTASGQDERQIAHAVARNFLQPRARQWLVDISNLCVRDAGTGIQRVVRHVLDELMAEPPAGYRLEPVYLDDGGTFRYARDYCARRYFSGIALPADEPVEFGDDDIYLGLDLVAHKIPAFIHVFRELRNRGIKQYFVVYDLLPILRPDCFEPHLLPLFRAWYEAVSEVADGLVCISRSVADQLSYWLDQYRPARRRSLGIGYFHLGADLESSSVPIQRDTNGLPEKFFDCPSVLMVGTIEPRKGHEQALRAFELLWDKGTEIHLLIVGRPGWLSEEIIRRLRSHPEQGRRLLWIENADDAQLLFAYRNASVLLMASEGEGYGLPLIEAAHHRLPLLVRDLDVFREVAGEHATYFSGFDAADLVRALEAWLRLHGQARVPKSDDIQWQTWRQASAQLMDVVQNERWIHVWQVSQIRRHAAYDHRLLTDIGRLIRGRLQTTGNAGMLLYGPSLPLPAGRYRVSVLGGWNASQGSAWMDITTGEAAVPIIRKSLSPRVSEAPISLIDLEWTLPGDATSYQIRIFTDERASFWIEEIVLMPLGAGAKSMPFAANKGADGSEPDASEGMTNRITGMSA